MKEEREKTRKRRRGLRAAVLVDMQQAIAIRVEASSSVNQALDGGLLQAPPAVSVGSGARVAIAMSMRRRQAGLLPVTSL